MISLKSPYTYFPLDAMNEKLLNLNISDHNTFMQHAKLNKIRILKTNYI
jgi:hypothetical protein